MNKTFLPLLLAAALGTSPAYAFDSSDPFGMNGAQADKPAKAQREKNDGHFLEDMAKNFGTGVGVGAAGGALMGAAVLNPLFIVGGSLVIGTKIMNDRLAATNAFYSGTVVRGKVTGSVMLKRIFRRGGLEKAYGIDLATTPDQVSIDEKYTDVCVDVDGPSHALVCAYMPSSVHVGDIVDIKFPVGMFFFNTKVFDNPHFDFNKHYPRVVNVYCKHDNPACQNDYESSLGVISRHTDTEFQPSQYLIDPAIIAADQAKMRKEAEESKAAANNGGFSFM